jgi:hypothetical protein
MVDRAVIKETDPNSTGNRNQTSGNELREPPGERASLELLRGAATGERFIEFAAECIRHARLIARVVNEALQLAAILGRSKSTALANSRKH